MFKFSNTLAYLANFLGFTAHVEAEIIEGSGKCRLIVTLTDDTRIEAPDHEIKITPEGEVYFKVYNRWTLQANVKSIAYIKQ